MATLTVLYPAAGTRFDRDYYAVHHSKAVHDAWDSAGLTSMTVTYGEGALGGGDAPFHVITTLSFASRAALDAAVASPAAGPVFADIPNFTDATPIAMIGSA